MGWVLVVWVIIGNFEDLQTDLGLLSWCKVKLYIIDLSSPFNMQYDVLSSSELAEGASNYDVN